MAAATFRYGAHVHANGIRQHYLRYGGRGRPVLLVPGITSPAITWGFVAAELAASHDVFVLDVRGRGLSEAGPQLDYRLDACADDLAAVAAELGLEPPIVIGHSMGARHAIRAARRHPGAFARLVLADPPVSGPGRRQYPTPLAWYLEAMALARRGADAAQLRRFTPSWSDAELTLRAEWLHTCEEAAVRASFAGFHDDDIHRDLPRLDLPMLLVVAERGDVVRDEEAREIAALVPGLDWVRVANAGHMIPWDNLAGFLAALRPALAA